MQSPLGNEINRELAQGFVQQVYDCIGKSMDVSYEENVVLIEIAQDKSDPISLDTVSTTMTAAKEVDDDRTQAEADSWQ
jgi:hypothetical protein